MIKGLVPALLATLTCAGCMHPHDHKHNVEYASVPFLFGTNTPVEISTNLRARGTYHLYFLLRTDSLPQDEKGRVPIWLDTPVHALVLTNGRPALDDDITRLFLINRNKDTANYPLALFHAEMNAQVVCRVQDVSAGNIRAHGSLNLQLMRHH